MAKKKWKKILALVISAAMVMGMMTVTAMASGRGGHGGGGGGGRWPGGGGNGGGIEYIKVTLNGEEIYYDSGNSITWLANGEYDLDYDFDMETGEFYFSVVDTDEPNIAHNWSTVIAPPEGYTFAQCDVSHSSSGVNDDAEPYDNLTISIVITALSNDDGEIIPVDPGDDPTVPPEDPTLLI